MCKRTPILILLFLFGILPFLVNGIYNPLIADERLLFWLLEVFAWVVVPCAIILAGILGGVFSLREAGMDLRVGDSADREKNALYLLILFMAVPPVLYIAYSYFYDLSEMLFPVNFGEVDFDYESMIPKEPHIRLLVSVYLSITAGIVEEFYYRGILYTVFTDLKRSTVEYVIISSLIFSSVHWEGGVQNLFATFIFGIVCSVIYVRIKNIWPLALGHFVVDYILFIR